METMSGLSQTSVAEKWGCYANRWHSWSIFREHNEAVFQAANHQIQTKKEGTEREKNGH